MGTVLLVVHLIVAIFLVAVILLQRSTGGALDGLGGGSGASNFLTARGTGNLLTRTTAILATLFIITSISLSFYYKGRNTTNQSLIDSIAAAETQQAAPAAPAAPESNRRAERRSPRIRSCRDGRPVRFYGGRRGGSAP